MIAVDHLSARVGTFELRDVTFSVPTGGYGIVLGPAGAGKTTLLETIAGVVPALSGTVRLGSVDVTHLRPESRGVGLVYQHAYLFPHLTVEQNIAYGTSGDVAFEHDIAARLGIESLRGRPIRTLSGGERQLVALARSLVRCPQVLLLDEPFSALDPRRRSRIRREVRSIHQQIGCTVLQVTHDFAEAGLLGDLAIVMDAGGVAQAGPPSAVFQRPATADVAEFLGVENVYAGTVTPAPTSNGAGEARILDIALAEAPIHFTAVGEAGPGPAHAVLRAEDVVISRVAPESSARNCFAGSVIDVSPAGALTRVTVDAAGLSIAAVLTTQSAKELALAPGVAVFASFKATAVVVC